MDEKKIITLDLTDCKYLGELHERIRAAFDFPEWYGANLDAFWDLLSRESDADEVIIKGVKTMSGDLIDYMNKLYDIFDRNVIKWKNYSEIYDDIKPFSYRIDS